MTTKISPTKTTLFACWLALVALANSTATVNAAEPLKVGSLKVDKVLYLGNSITLHSPAPKIGWLGNWGMAASAADKDYVNLLTEKIAKAAGGRPQIKVRNIADFERSLQDYDVCESLKEELAFEADVVIFAIGENSAAPKSDEERTRFFDAYSNLLAEIQKHGRPTIFVRSQFWPDQEKDPLIKKACEKTGCQYVDIRAIGLDPSHAARAERMIEHAGVAGHPGDKGMAAIASALWSAIETFARK